MKVHCILVVGNKGHNMNYVRVHVDMIMDMLGNPKLRQIITESYQCSSEPKRVRDAITEVRYDIIVLRNAMYK